jgi:HEAT repeat protein
VPELDDLLVELTSGDDSRAEGVIPALLALGERAFHALLALTRSTDPDVRWWTVRALAGSPLTRPDDLLPLLGDPAPEVRAAAALALSSHPHESSVPDLVRALSDEDSLTAGLAGNALVAIGGPAVPALLQVMQEGPVGVRILALRALAEIRDQRSIRTLMKALEDDSAILQYWAREGLERLGLDMVYIKP